MLLEAPYDAFSARRAMVAPSANYALITTIRKKKSPKRPKTQVLGCRFSRNGVEWGVNAGSSVAPETLRSKYYIRPKGSGGVGGEKNGKSHTN